MTKHISSNEEEFNIIMNPDVEEHFYKQISTYIPPPQPGLQVTLLQKIQNFMFMHLINNIEDPETKDVLYQENEQLEITQSKTLDKRVQLSGLNVSTRRYIFNVTVKYDSKIASAYDDFEVTEAFWTTDRINLAIMIIAVISTPASLPATKTHVVRPRSTVVTKPFIASL